MPPNWTPSPIILTLKACTLTNSPDWSETMAAINCYI